MNEGPVHRPSNYYSIALRCIGQTLQSIELKSLEVKLQGDCFVVQGWNKSSGTMEIEKRYSDEDIRQIDSDGRAQRKPNPAPPNLLSLSQVLRFCGSYVDRLRGRLTRVSWQDQSDKIQSITIQFEPHDNPGSTIEELCIHVYKQRKRITGVEKTWQRPNNHIFNGL